MFKQITIAEIKVGERVYSLLCDSQSPLGELHDVLMKMKGEVVEKMISAQKQEEEMSKKQQELDEAKE